MLILVRAVVYASAFIGVLLVFLPGQLLERFGVPSPERIGLQQVAGGFVTTVGGVLSVACILTFVFVGRGTPLPLDPPRRLVARGPYRMIRNPMYVGAGLVLLGAALYYGSLVLVGYAAAFLLAMHLLVLFYEEPTLRRTFGADYEEYCRRVGRWWPRLTSTG